jgi:hypothetical protein
MKILTFIELFAPLIVLALGLSLLLKRDRRSLSSRFKAVVAGLSLEVGALTSSRENDLQRGVDRDVHHRVAGPRPHPAAEIEGNAYAYNEEATLPGVEFRAVNAAYSESTGTVNQKTESLVILGGDADVDTFIQKTRSNLNDQRAVQSEMKVKAGDLQVPGHVHQRRHRRRRQQLRRPQEAPDGRAGHRRGDERPAGHRGGTTPTSTRSSTSSTR